LIETLAFQFDQFEDFAVDSTKARASRNMANNTSTPISIVGEGMDDPTARSTIGRSDFADIRSSYDAARITTEQNANNVEMNITPNRTMDIGEESSQRGEEQIAHRDEHIATARENSERHDSPCEEAPSAVQNTSDAETETPLSR
jgi:hypothetical protein